jgi:cytochrome c peroxidase
MKKFSLAVMAAVLLASCGGSPEPKETKEDSSKETSNEAAVALQKQAAAYFQSLPEAAPFGSAMTQLGKKLYYETALSANGEMSCNSCHMLDKYGVDNEATSPGHEGKRGDRNSPSTYNAYFHIAQFWDGRAADLKAQAAGPVLNPIEMGLPDSNAAVKNIKGIEDYVALFNEAFPGAQDPINYDNITEAIGEFEKTLSTPSRFDDYLAGDLAALSDAEQKGLETFINTGCITCHMGGGLGGTMYQKFGLVQGPYWEFTGSEQQDEGRFAVTGNESEKYFFKVPSLRNIANTAPYFHDGSVADLGKAIDIMAKTQLGKELSQEEITSIQTFLEALTGDLPEHALLASN